MQTRQIGNKIMSKKNADEKIQLYTSAMSPMVPVMNTSMPMKLQSLRNAEANATIEPVIQTVPISSQDFA